MSSFIYLISKDFHPAGMHPLIRPPPPPPFHILLFINLEFLLTSVKPMRRNWDSKFDKASGIIADFAAVKLHRVPSEKGHPLTTEFTMTWVTGVKINKQKPHLKWSQDETSLVVQWLRLHVSTAGGTGSNPGRGTIN